MIEVRINPQNKLITETRALAKRNDWKLILDPKADLDTVYILNPSYVYLEEIT